MNYPPSVDVVIPCYNVGHNVKKCVESVLSQKYENETNYFLINDGSTDNTGEILDSFSKQKNVVVIHHEKNRGLSAARNSGINAGHGEVICFLDSDMTVKRDWIAVHLDVLGEEGTVGVIGDNMLPAGKKANTLDKYFYDKRRGARRFGEGVPIGFPYFLFNNASLKRSVFEKIDLFDETIKTYGGEDTEFAIRLWEANPYSLRFSSKAMSKHNHERELKEFCKSMHHFGKANLPSLIRKYPHYSKELGGDYIFSVKGCLVFNPIVRCGIRIISKFFVYYWLTRYQVVDAIIRGARYSSL